MVALLLEVEEEPGVERDAILTAIREQAVPAVKSVPGFQSGTWVLGNGFGKWVALTLFDTAAHAQGTLDRLSDHRGRSVTGGPIVRFEVREIAAVA
jgi:hypothetical protein